MQAWTDSDHFTHQSTHLQIDRPSAVLTLKLLDRTVSECVRDLPCGVWDRDGPIHSAIDLRKIITAQAEHLFFES